MNNHLIELAKNKLILLYVLDYNPNLYNNHTLTNFILQNELMNYFLLNQYLTELSESDFIEADSRGLLQPTPLGEETLNFFKYQITRPELENLDKLLNKSMEALQPIEYSGTLMDDFLQLRAVKGSQLVFELKLTNEDASSGHDIIENFQAHGDDILEKIRDILSLKNQGPFMDPKEK